MENQLTEPITNQLFSYIVQMRNTTNDKWIDYAAFEYYDVAVEFLNCRLCKEIASKNDMSKAMDTIKNLWRIIERKENQFIDLSEPKQPPFIYGIQYYNTKTDEWITYSMFNNFESLNEFMNYHIFKETVIKNCDIWKAIELSEKVWRFVIYEE